MPPYVYTSPTSQPLQTHHTTSPNSNTHKYFHLKGMEITLLSKRFIHIFVFILAFMSIFRLLRFAITSYSLQPHSNWVYHIKPCNSSRCNEVPLISIPPSFLPKRKPITKKEFQFLSNMITKKTPLNLLIFGWEPQYHHLAKMNVLGSNVFLVENPEKIKQIRRLNAAKIYNVSYDIKAKEAYNMLKYAREEKGCAFISGNVQKSVCKLALKNLPKEIYEKKWDVIIVDGPSSDGPEAHGRMSVIYTASMIARAGNFTTDVVVHDVDRTIERWFSREFLCEENLVLSKGRYWNFRIKGGERRNSGIFCSGVEAMIGS